MELLNKIFGRKVDYVKKSKYSQDQAVIVTFFNYEFEGLEELHELEKKLDDVITKNSLGKYDGHEIALDGTDGTLFMYGLSAEQLFIAVRPILEETDFMRGAIAILRFGPAGHRKKIEIEI